MSYCRWSSDNFKCDLYCYEYVYGGYVTHVAGRRLINHTPLEERDILLDYEDIKLPHAGEVFNDETLEDFLERLIYLRGLGYKFPDYVIEAVKQEIDEAA